MSAAHKAQSPAATGLSADQNTHHILDDDKREANLRARFALKGAIVHRLSDGGFLVSQWGMARACPDLPALAVFAKMMGVL